MTPELQRLVSGASVALVAHPLPESTRWSIAGGGLEVAGVEPLVAGRARPAERFRLELYADTEARGLPLLTVERKRIPLLKDVLLISREAVVMAQLVHRARPLHSFEELRGPDERVIGRANGELPVTFMLGVAESAQLTAEGEGAYKLAFTPGSDTVQRPVLLAAAWGWLHRHRADYAAKAAKLAAKAERAAQAAAAPEPTPAPKPDPKPTPEPKPDPKPAPEVEPRVDPRPAPEHDPLPPPMPAGDPAPQPMGDPVGPTSPTAELRAEPAPESKIEAQRPKTKAERKAERRAQAEVESVVMATVVTVETVEVETSK